MTTTNPAPGERVSVLTAEERAGLLALCDRKAKFGGKFRARRIQIHMPRKSCEPNDSPALRSVGQWTDNRIVAGIASQNGSHPIGTPRSVD